MLRLALLGDPIGHSLSPVIHCAALQSAGIPGRYESRRVDRDGVVEAIAGLRAGHLDGVNVTMPHKPLAAELCDQLSEDAARAGSANTLFVREGRIHGESTDVTAARSLLESLPAAPIHLLGAGGASAAALLASEGRDIRVAARRTAAAQVMVDSLAVDASVIEWGTPVPDAIVINATPLGMKGERLPSGVVDRASGLLDMAYAPAATPAVQEARESGIPCLDGRQMLVAQAAESFQIWSGVVASTEAMKNALS